MSNVLALALTIIFQASLNQGRVPGDRRSVYVILFKKGDKTRASKYSQVSLTSLCYKVVKHIVQSQVINHLEENNILADEQHDLTKRRSCESQLIINDLAKGLENKQLIDTITLDFSKAFDKVPHETPLCSQIESFLSIVVNKSEWMESHRRRPQ